MYAWLRLRIFLKYRGFYGVNLAEIHKIQARTVQRIFFFYFPAERRGNIKEIGQLSE